MTSQADIYKKLLDFKQNVILSLSEIQDLDICCKSILQRCLNDIQSTDTSCVIKIEAIIDYMYEQVNIGNWKEVKLYLRKTLTIASYLKILVQIKCANEFTESFVKEAFKSIDFGIVFGCPVDIEPKLLQTCATILSPLYSSPLCDSAADISNLDTDKFNIESSINKTIFVGYEDCPSMETFYQKYIMTETPVILKNCINNWPALTKWQDQNYFLKLAGPRTVAIEVGRDYTDSEWTQKLMTIEDFIKDHIHNSNGPTGYLAQYQLFEQIPELKEDIREPEYCSFADTDDPINIMAWYGPKGTVSPLHQDPKKNLLAQVVGEKQIFLFSPTDSEYLYPHEHELLINTARIDPRKPDYVKYPKYRAAKVYYCVLKPGQLLYIPPKWWHFVESLSISFSISFWWK